MGGRVVGPGDLPRAPALSPVGGCPGFATGQLLVEVVEGAGLPVGVLRLLPAVGVCPCAVPVAGHP
eukprot:2576663-Alexandrium_andersonii.AAC.1